MRRITPLVVALCLGAPTKARAYDSDTHFLLMNMMAQYVGIRPSVADQLAAYSQYIDVSWLTSPMFPTMVVGGRVRRLFHFPGSLQRATGNGHGILSLKVLSIATPNHPMGSELLVQGGLRRGSLLAAGAGLHPLADTFGHSGFPAQIGHATAGHWPDRPWYAPDKYEVMIRHVFAALVAIRESLPPEARIPSAESGLPADVLADRFLSRPDVQEFIRYDVFKDPRYTKPAVEFLLHEAERSGFLEQGVKAEQVYPADAEYRQGRDVQEILRDLALRGGQLRREGRPAFRLGMILEKVYPGTGIGRDLTVEEFEANARRLGDKRSIADIVVDAVADAHLADVLIGPMNPHGSMFVAEKETPLRTLEMKLRHEALQRIQFSLFSRMTDFSERGYSSRRASASPGRGDGHPGWQQIQARLAEVDPRIESVGLVLRDKAEWLRTIGRFLFFDALVGTFRFTPGADNLVYQNHRLLMDGVRSGTYKIHLPPEKLARLERAYAMRRCQAGLTDEGIPRGDS